MPTCYFFKNIIKLNTTNCIYVVCFLAHSKFMMQAKHIKK